MRKTTTLQGLCQTLFAPSVGLDVRSSMLLYFSSQVLSTGQKPVPECAAKFFTYGCTAR
jgi:hypothetical protein